MNPEKAKCYTSQKGNLPPNVQTLKILCSLVEANPLEGIYPQKLTPKVYKKLLTRRFFTQLFKINSWKKSKCFNNVELAELGHNY